MRHYYLPLLLILHPLLTNAQGLGGIASAPEPTTSNKPSEPTIVWVKSTLPDGGITVVASVYTQLFPSMYDAIATPSSGVIGLGTQTGEVGKPRETRASGGAGRREGGEAWVVGVVVGLLL